MQILVELEGVLKGDKNDEPIMTGVVMAGSLSSWNRMHYMTAMNSEQAKYWFDVNKIVDYDIIIDSSVGLEYENLSERQINVARAKGNIDLFITSNPKNWVYAFDLGIPSVLFGMPSYLRAEFRPDAPKRLRSWDQVQEAIDRQNQARTQDARLTRTETLNFE